MYSALVTDHFLIDAHCHRASAQGISIVSVDMSELYDSAVGPALAFGGDGEIGPAPLTAGLPSGAIGSQSDKAHASTGSGRAVFNDLIDYDPQISGYFSLGIHPWFLDRQAPEPALAHLERLAEHPRILAIGECGLDKCIAAPMPRQIEVFNRQIAIAENLGKPVIVHCVRAYAELLQLRKRLKPRQDWIVHGFSGKPALAEQLLQHGCYLSFGKAILLTRPLNSVRPEPAEEPTTADFDNPNLNENPLIDSNGFIRLDSQAAESLKIVPPERLFLETDAAIDVSIGEIYAAAAKILGFDLADLKRRIASNFNRVFPHD